MTSRLPLLLLAVALATNGVEQSPLIDVGITLPGLDVRIRYASHDNFTGTRVDGYDAPRCLLTEPAAAALARVAQDASELGLRLVVFDCYRPQRAVDHFMRWTTLPDDAASRAEYYPNVAKSALVPEGYIAEKSGHSRGSTIDLTLARADGELVDMGTPWDYFDPLSWTESPAVSAAARLNRLLLRDLMERHGFQNYAQEWWHYTLRNEPMPDTYLDMPVR
ncbi:M15 family metallopeptidase [Pseudohalioglobus sediminis]|nr:M15 family metallopeptidase [Pseudohalioglobus sediminis]